MPEGFVAPSGPAAAVDRPAPFVVVLTGGPSSGKSSALALLRDRLSTRGFQVLTVPENATHFLANSDGFQPEWAGAHSQVCMQRIFLDYQLAQEQAFMDFARLHPTKPAVLLLDCCTINSRVYLSDEQWREALTLPGKPVLTEEELCKRYDLVIHMVTCAGGSNYEWGPGSNNPGRYHTPEQAKEADNRSLEAFGAHPQLRVVPHFGNFEEKIGKVVEFVNDALHIEGLTGTRRRRRCAAAQPEALDELAAAQSTSSALVTSTFLDEQMQHSVRRRADVPNTVWLEGFRRLGEPVTDEPDFADVFYERRAKVVQAKACGDMSQSYLTRKVLKKEEYDATLGCAGEKALSATKCVLRFLANGRYYELFFYSGHKDLVLDFDTEVKELPTWLQLIGDRDLSRQDSEVRAKPGPPSPGKPRSHECPVQPAKRPRLLRPHSTEEFAFGAEKGA